MSDEREYDDEPYHGTQILWGRVLVLLLALALAFWLGTTFGGDASAQVQLEEQRAEIVKLESQIESLEAEVAAVDAGGRPDEQPAASEPASESAAAKPAAASEAPEDDKKNDEKTEEYVVQSGDSLASIAQQVYGDPTLWREIARANDLREPYALRVGETLEVPEQP